MQETWKYKVVTLKRISTGVWAVAAEDWIQNTVPTSNPVQAADRLAQLGKEGWELVSSYTVVEGEGAYPLQPTLLFKQRMGG